MAVGFKAMRASTQYLRSFRVDRNPGPRIACNMGSLRATSSYPQAVEEMPPTRKSDSPGQPMNTRPGRLVQAHITCRERQSVLLGRWKAGPFEGRVSGMIGLTNQGETPEEAASRLSKTLSGLDVPADTFQRRAIFGFVETDNQDAAAKNFGTTYEELQLVCDREADCGLQPVETEVFAPLGWIPLNEVPYDLMPADDELWYPKVLSVAAPNYGGRFWFEGQQLIKHAIWTLNDDKLTNLTADQRPDTAGKPTLQASL